MRKLARFVLARPRTVVAAWVIALVLGGGFAAGLQGRVQNGGYVPSGSQSQRASDIGESEFSRDPTPQAYLSVVATGGGSVSPAAVAQASRAVGKAPSVVSVTPPLVSPDRSAALAGVVMEGDLAEAQTKIADVQTALGDEHLPGAKAQMIGEAAAFDQYTVQSQKSLTGSSAISFPVMLIILLFAFQAVVAACLPLVLAAISVVCTFALLFVITYVVPLSSFVEDTVLVLGLGLSIDFSLFIVTRVREALERHPGDTAASIAEALDTTGRAILGSGLTIAVALAGLYATGLGIFGSLATGAIGATVVAVLAALTLAPAVLSMLGPRIDKFPLRIAVRAARTATLWGRLADFVVKRRVAVLLVTIPVMLVLSIPLKSMDVKQNAFSVLPSDNPVRSAGERVSQAFGPGAGTPANVIARSEPAEVRRALGGQPGIASIGQPELGSDGWSRTAVVLAADPDSDAAMDTVHRMRSVLERRVDGDVAVGGATAESIDLIDRINDRTPLVVGIVLLVEILLLSAIFRAPVIAVKAALTTLLSVTAALGATSFLFGGDVTYFVPLFLFVTVFGLSTDYEVFLLSRVREQHRRGSETRDSLREAMVRSARSITLAGLTMSVVFFSFAISPLEPFQQLGVGLGLAIVLDVTIVRGLLVPAAVAMLGELNWWVPGRSRGNGIGHHPPAGTST